MTQQRVLVTGGSGFIAGHCILQLLEQGYLVRATVRSLHREAAVRSVLTEAGMVNGDALSFVAADLTDDAGWADAVADVDFVLHVASPVQPGHVDDPDELIVPAREGTLRVLRAARDAGVTRVVLTSAFHAVGWGHPHDDHVFTEADWTVIDGPGVDAYGVSKTLAERAAWDFARDEGGSTELVTMLPVAVMGPIMGKDVSGSNHIIQRILEGDMPGFPNLFFPIVDVRDVAAAHILAMTTQEAAGQRFLISNGPAVPMKEIGALIRSSLGAAAPNVPTRSIPDLVVRTGAKVSAQMRGIAADLGYARKTSNDKARKVLGWQPRGPEEAIVAAAQSLVAKGLVKTK
ncbi:aldehyde reductase [Amycolatopsis sp. GM8]|uniref:SDR family oxidoreductase n=1 Tax=Amycolatopsis sp. GM8 TaxID=2896530 RepID=UPI001F173A05|nr:aldehyde reductase [Amycolatopsis sp. GM8]